MSFSLHSSTENFGGGRRSSSAGSNSNSSCSVSVKSLIGLMSRNVSASPWWRNHSKDSRWIAIRSGRGRASSRLANEYRCREAVREGKETYFPCKGSGRMVPRLRRADAAEKNSEAGTRSGTATEEGTTTREERQPVEPRPTGNPKSCEDSKPDAAPGQGLTDVSNDSRSADKVCESTAAF